MTGTAVQNVMKKGVIGLLCVLLSSLGSPLLAQKPADSLARQAYLNDCLLYALNNYPIVRQSLIDQEITDRNIKVAQSSWYPQLTSGYSLIHYLKLPVTQIPDVNTGERRNVTLGAQNTSVASFSLSQNILSRDLLLANRTAEAYRLQAAQTTTLNKIDVVVNVSKAYYDVVLTQRQADILTEDIVRLQRSLQDASNQYQSGVVDKTDPQRAQVALNNALAQRKQYTDLVGAKIQVLKQYMGYPPTTRLGVAYDTLQLVRDTALDTLQLANPASRVEYQQLRTQRELLDANVRYARWAYLPSVSAIANYNFQYQNNTFTQLYSQVFPNSLIGLSVVLPIFQGGRRVQQLRIAELQVKRLDWDFVSLTNSVDAEYAQALSVYKGNLANYYALVANQQLAQDNYRIINLQYRSGVRAYLDVTVAEADLRTARLNVFNALYQVLVSRVDVIRALGEYRF